VRGGGSGEDEEGEQGEDDAHYRNVA